MLQDKMQKISNWLDSLPKLKRKTKKRESMKTCNNLAVSSPENNDKIRSTSKRQKLLRSSGRISFNGSKKSIKLSNANNTSNPSVVAVAVETSDQTWIPHSDFEANRRVAEPVSCIFSQE